MFRPLPIFVVLLLASCAAPAPRPLTNDHPASPDAPASEISRPSALHSVPPSEAPRSDATHLQPSAQPDAHAHHPPTTTTPTPESKPLFRCPMHPEVTSSDPDAKCPKCGMSLEPIKEGARP